MFIGLLRLAAATNHKDNNQNKFLIGMVLKTFLLLCVCCLGTKGKQFQLTIKTGISDGAGTDNDVYFRFNDLKNTSTKIDASKMSNFFENDAEETFSATVTMTSANTIKNILFIVQTCSLYKLTFSGVIAER